MSRPGTPRRALGLATLGLAATGLLATPPLRAQDPSGVLGEVLRLGRLRAGVLLSNPPWGHVNPWGEPDGYEVALMQHLAVALAVRLDLVSLSPEERLPAVEQGRVDVLAAATPLDPRTMARVALSRPHGVLTGVMAMRAGEGVRGFEALRGRRVAVAAGTYIAEAAAAALGPGTETLFLADFASCLQAVANRDADGAAIPEWVLRRALLDEPESVLREAFAIRRWRVGLAVGLGEHDMLHHVNGFLRIEQRSGSLARLQRLFFQGATFDIGRTP